VSCVSQELRRRCLRGLRCSAFRGSFFLFVEGFSFDLQTVKERQDGAATEARSSAGEPRSEEWCGQARSDNSV
jgi:hypothetical protein